ncbi:unnamed protein product [Trichobilharzia regenti]|nr:unnamed protein product [Trichobilharzia regenti]
MLEKFDRTLNIEEIVSSVKSLYPSLRRPLPSPSMMNKMNSQAEVIPTAPPIMCSSSSAVANNNTSIFTSTSLITNMNLYQPVDNYCHGDNNDNQLPINNNDDDSENNLAENNSFNAETTTTTLEEYDQSEHWLTPTG